MEHCSATGVAHGPEAQLERMGNSGTKNCLSVQTMEGSIQQPSMEGVTHVPSKPVDLDESGTFAYEGTLGEVHGELPAYGVEETSYTGLGSSGPGEHMTGTGTNTEPTTSSPLGILKIIR